MTTDPKASLAFYTELFKWSTKDADMGPMGTYTMFFAGEKGLGGMMPLDAKGGAPSHWVTYITVDDVDAAAARVPGLGGKVTVPPMDIPEVGRFAVVTDATGAVTAPFKEAKPTPEDTGTPGVGTFCWGELMTTDPEAATKFYTGLYGWSAQESDMGPEIGKYTVVSRGDSMTGGIMKTPPGAPPISFWVSHVLVENVDTTAAQAEKLGGKIVMPPMDIPNMGRAAMLADPSGAVMAIFQEKAR